MDDFQERGTDGDRWVNFHGELLGFLHANFIVVLAPGSRSRPGPVSGAMAMEAGVFRT